MPELPEVETVVRGLREDVIGRTITGMEVSWARELAGLGPVEFADRIVGQRIEGLHRRGKYIVFELTHDVMLIHLKMSGRLYVADVGQVTDNDWTRVAFQLDNGRELRFLMRGSSGVYSHADEADVTGKFGPEPLSEEFGLDLFAFAYWVSARHHKISAAESDISGRCRQHLC
jgi:formamidopyrimidine-DNA glycosylase